MEPVHGILKLTQREYVFLWTGENLWIICDVDTAQNLRLISLTDFSNSQIFNMERGLLL